MSAVTLVHRLTSMRLPLGAFWSLGKTRCCRRGSSILRTSVQVDDTVMLAEICHQDALCYGHSVTRSQRLSLMRLRAAIANRRRDELVRTRSTQSQRREHDAGMLVPYKLWRFKVVWCSLATGTWKVRDGEYSGISCPKSG